MTDIAALEARHRHGAPRVSVRSPTLLNNAANDQRHTIEATTSASWDAGIAVNLKHQFFAARKVAADMKARGGGSIVNFGSISWKLKQGGMPVYTTAKAAVQGLTRSLARDFGPFNIRVNTLVPGWVMTEKQQRLWLDDAGARRDRARPVHRTSRCCRSTSRAWRCSSPPTTAPCAPRRTSSSTAAGSERRARITRRPYGQPARRARGGRVHARQRPRPDAARPSTSAAS